MATRRVRDRIRLARQDRSAWLGGLLNRDTAETSSDVASSIPTRTIGDWRLLDEIGRGAWTRVYLARPADARRSRSGCYAVKTLDPSWDGDPLALAALRREALVGMTVTHPHLISILAAHVHEAPHYLVSPFLPGPTLAERLRSGRLEFRTATWIARQVAAALAALHNANWLHRDVKPANIIVSPAGHATLVDLGFCQQLNRPPALEDRPIAGTFNYLSPEAATPGVACTIASDLYSLGVVLFELLAGQVPFQGRTAAELAQKHRQAPPPFDALPTNLPSQLVELLRELLAKQPIRRPASAQEVVDRLIRLEIASLATMK